LIEKLRQVRQSVCFPELESMRHFSRGPGSGALTQTLERIDNSTRNQHAEEGSPKEKHWDGNPHGVAQQEQLARGYLAIR
jgi:hypothetical protein